MINLSTLSTICSIIILIFNLIMILLNKKTFLNFFLRFKKKTITLLLVIIIMSAIINFTAPHFHRWYTDEPNSLEKSKTIITNEEYSQIKYRHPIGWSLLLTIPFLILGLKTNIALYFTSILGFITVINIFGITFILTKKIRISLFSAFIYSLIPIIIKYSGTATNNVPSNFFLTLTIFVMLISYKQESKKKNLLTASLIALSSLFRTENYFLFVYYFIGQFLLNRKKRISAINISLLMIAFIITVPNLMNNFYLYFDDSLAKGNMGSENVDNWSLKNLSEKQDFTKELFSNSIHPFFFSLLWITGILFGIKSNKKETMFLLAYIIPIIIVFSIYFYESSRYFITIYPFIIILSTLSLDFIINRFNNKKQIIYVLIIIFVITFLPYIKRVNADVWIPHSLETIIPDLLEQDLKKDCIIIAIMPTVLKATTNLQVISATSFIEKTRIVDADCILFFEDMYCDGTFGKAPECDYIKNNYEYSTYLNYSYSYKGNSKIYNFYLLEI